MGSDSHYYQRRDYNANDTPLGVGGFGSIIYCRDLTSNQLFAVKRNNRPDESSIDSIHTEASLLSRLGLHSNVIQMYGAVIDEQESEFQPTKVYKLMMELAERMLKHFLFPLTFLVSLFLFFSSRRGPNKEAM